MASICARRTTPSAGRSPTSTASTSAGPDLGTGAPELAVVRAHTRWVNPEGNDAGAATAAGVLAALRAVWRRIEATAARRVALQGLGSVGRNVAQALLAEGVDVVGADPVASVLGIRKVAPAKIAHVACDVFMPCALSGALTADVAARAVCGSANNQLARPEVAGSAPRRRGRSRADIVTSAGAVIEGVLTLLERAGPPRVAAAIARIEAVTDEVLQEAARAGRPPTEVALQRARALVPSGR